MRRGSECGESLAACMLDITRWYGRAPRGQADRLELLNGLDAESLLHYN